MDSSLVLRGKEKASRSGLQRPLPDKERRSKVFKILFSSSLRRPLSVLTLVAMDALALLIGLGLGG